MLSQNKMAQLHVYTGPMASGKTSSLLSAIHKYSNVVKERVLLVNFLGDDRGTSGSTHEDSDMRTPNGTPNGVSTHQYGDYNLKIPLGIYVDPVRVSSLAELSDELISRYSVIGIDEAHFYPDLKEFIEKNFRKKDLIIYVSGLSYDSSNNKFGEVADLLPLATSFEKMNAICAACKPHAMVPAGFTFCNEAKDSVVKIGGLEMYSPRCAYHYFGGD